MNFRKLGTAVAGFGTRGFTSAAKKAVSKPWGWSTRIVAVAGSGTLAYWTWDHQLHPRPTTEILDDLMLQKPLNSRKERVVVLGSGWGAVSLLAQLDPFKYDIVCISPRNHFVMTPLLPSVTVGTIEARTIVESIRAICPHVTFVEAEVCLRAFNSRVAVPSLLLLSSFSCPVLSSGLSCDPPSDPALLPRSILLPSLHSSLLHPPVSSAQASTRTRRCCRLSMAPAT